MNVWILEWGARYESHSTEGVYATKELAIKEAKKRLEDKDRDDKWKLDQETDDFMRWEDKYDNLILIIKHEVKE